MISLIYFGRNIYLCTCLVSYYLVKYTKSLMLIPYLYFLVS